jgi:hypothetical protein
MQDPDDGREMMQFISKKMKMRGTLNCSQSGSPVARTEAT